MQYIIRNIEAPIHAALERNKSILLLGARQTGKTTLISRLPVDLSISFIQPRIRQLYEQNPSQLTAEIEAFAEKQNSGKMPLVVIDEVQKVPEIMDVVQDLIDRRIAKFILTGSSARKLRKGAKINLLPGRVVVLRLDPLMLSEIGSRKCAIEDLLIFGSLPGIFTVQDPHDKEIDLSSYVTTYLEEEIRAEAVVRNVGIFAKFLTLAAIESGNPVNFSKISQEIGVAHTTIASYYQILNDCLIAETVEPLSKSRTRKKLTKSPKYLFFDMGIRRMSAEEGTLLPEQYLGKLFEQWVGLELIRAARLIDRTIKINFWRDTDGPEVDWVISKGNDYLPIEVKWTEQPNESDIRHLKLFREEYSTSKAYVVCRVTRRQKLFDSIYAIPWQEIDELIQEFNSHKT